MALCAWLPFILKFRVGSGVTSGSISTLTAGCGWFLGYNELPYSRSKQSYSVTNTKTYTSYYIHHTPLTSYTTLTKRGF